jgi:hypothetical protein
MSWIWGHTGKSLFDYWFLAHIAFWFFVGSSLAAAKLNRAIAFAVCVGLAFWWEVFEKGAEKWWPHIWQSPESWLNSWVSDMLATTFVLIAFYGYDKWRPK